MKAEMLDLLADARDFTALTQAVLAICEPIGPVHSFRFTYNRRAGRVACSIELESAKDQALLARTLGAHRSSGGAVTLEVPVSGDFEGGAPGRGARPARQTREPEMRV